MLRFSERMSGYIAAAPPVGGDFESAYEAGRAQGTSIQFETTIVHDDLPSLLDDPSSPATLTGTVLAPMLCPSPMDVVEGTFVLLEPRPEEVERDWMRYRMTLRSRTDPSRTFLLEGHKVIKVGSILAAWKHTTTLYVTIFDTANPGAPRALGMMHIGLTDVHHLLAHAEVLNVGGAAREGYLVRFVAMFTRSIWPFYGGALNELGRFAASASASASASAESTAMRPRPRRRAGDDDTVLLCDPAGRWHASGDVPDACSRLVRYRGGDKGPVMLASGFAMSVTSLLTPTIHPNLVEVLLDGGYDVWLFDYRAGIDLPSATTQFTVDDIAFTDWPRAVDEVLRVTGAPTVQVFGHCVGSVSLLMALLDGGNGMQGKVRSAVCAQFSLHPVTAELKVLEADIHFGNLLEAAHRRLLHPDVDRSPGNVVLDLALHAVPLPRGEACELPVCRWINAVFGLTHLHAQLDDPTHKALPDMFGVANIRCLEHLGLMMQKARAVDAHGRDRYLRRPDLLRDVPVHFLAGERNYVFHPEGTERTVRWLTDHNGPGNHTMRLLPGYGHLDALVGRDVAHDVFPDIIEHLDAYPR
jgi:cholesterol oxidase